MEYNTEILIKRIFMSCFCGDKRDFQECCGAIIDGSRCAKTPQELMRSRYSAYVIGDGEYLVKTTIKENRYENDIELIMEFSKNSKWLKLDILESKDNSVEFKAYYKEADTIKILHEKSNFVKENGKWFYKDGIIFHTKVQRNEPCPCGSGKKYKKCCAK